MKRISILLLTFLCVATLSAQKPSIGFVYPAGVRPGQTVTITVGGQNIANATEAIISGEGVRRYFRLTSPKPERRKTKYPRKTSGKKTTCRLLRESIYWSKYPTRRLQA